MTVNPPLEGLEVIAAGENPCWQGVPPHGRPIEGAGGEKFWEYLASPCMGALYSLVVCGDQK